MTRRFSLEKKWSLDQMVILQYGMKSKKTAKLKTLYGEKKLILVFYESSSFFLGFPFL